MVSSFATSHEQFREPPAYWPGDDINIELFRRFQKAAGHDFLEQSSDISEDEWNAAMMVFALGRSLDQNFGFTDTSLLTQEMMALTTGSYDSNASFYGYRYEMNSHMIQLTNKNYLSQFITTVQDQKLNSSNLFIIGSGQGRDFIRLMVKGFKVDAIDQSAEMVRSTQSWAKDDSSIFHGDINSFDHEFPPGHFAGILNESAAEHSNKSDVSAQLHKYADWLCDDGVLLLRLRTSPTGNVFWTYDGVGLRFFTSWTDTEIHTLLAEHAVDFELIETWDTFHREADRPGFRALLLRRKSRIAEGVAT